MESDKKDIQNAQIMDKHIKIVKGYSKGNTTQEVNEYHFKCATYIYPVGDSIPADNFGFVRFQDGTIPEHGVNGIQVEDLIEVCIDRLQMFQSSDFPCRQNDLAITKLEEALHWLEARTADRRKRWVEGTCEA